jgi:hypothetical protein
MDDKIIDIYDLDNLKTNCNYFTMRITISNDKIYSFEIDGESHNINKINTVKTDKFSNVFELSHIIKDYGYNECLIGIKFQTHNIDTFKRFKSTFFCDYIYDGQIIIDNIKDIFELDIGKKFPILNGHIQIYIYELKISLDENKSVNSLYNCIHDNEYIHPDKYYYNLKSTTLYFKITYGTMDRHIREYKNSNKLIKTIEIPFTSNNKEGTLQIEMYKPCTSYCCCLITKIIYNEYIIDTVQNNKCNCIQYELLDYIKTDNIFYNRQKMCFCFSRKLFVKLNEMNIKYYKIDKNILTEKCYIQFDEDILRYFYIY